MKGSQKCGMYVERASAAVQELVGLFGGMMRGLLVEGACQDQSAK